LVKNRGASTLKQIDQYSKAVANPELQSTYKHAQKVLKFVQNINNKKNSMESYM